MQSTSLSDDEDINDAAEEKTRSGIQSIEVGFRLLDVLTNEPRAMMLRDLAQRVLEPEPAGELAPEPHHAVAPLDRRAGDPVRVGAPVAVRPGAGQRFTIVK